MKLFDRRNAARGLSIITVSPIMMMLTMQTGLVGSTAAATEPSRLAPTVTASVGLGSTATKIASQTVTGVRLTPVATKGDTHTYDVLLSDREGTPVNGAELDLGALQADPDIRVTTTPMTASGEPGAYRVTVAFPADGDWMLVVRVHSPSQAVELFTETITGAGGVPSHADAANSPSRRALRAADPTFSARYKPTASSSHTAKAPDAAAVGFAHESPTPTRSSVGAVTDHNDAPHSFDLSATIIVLTHAAAAAAWILAVAGLVFANRLKATNAQNAVLQFVALRYAQLAGGGLAVVTVTGLIVSLKASAGLAHPTQLATTTTGIAYLAIFGLKMVLVTGGIVTSWRIGKLMPTTRQFSLRNRLASAGAMANDDADAIPNVRAIFRLAETNMILAVAIIGCVAVLGQLHHAIH
jgi:YtkA-like